MSRGFLLALSLLLCLSGLPTWAAAGYRLTPLDNGSNGTMVFDLNRRGDVIGMRTVGSETHAFIWHAGKFTDLHDTIDPASSYTEAAGINDLSTIVGDKFDNFFEGFLLRGEQVSPIVVDGESEIYPIDINNREQIAVETANGSYLVEGTNVQPLEGLPGGNELIHAVAINERGAIAGNSFAFGTRAFLWQNGAVMDLGVVPGASSSFAYALNDRNQVVGIVNIGAASHAMRWCQGVMKLLPRLSPDEAGSSASSINNHGMIVGSTALSLPHYHQTATFWFGAHVVELDRLVRADDPLKPFVHLSSAQRINDRGDIVAAGTDSRTNARIIYFMTLFDN